MKHICIYTQSPLVAAPRVVKEANVYALAGYEVTVFALWYDKALLEKDRALLHESITYKAGVNLLDYNSLNSRYIRLKRKIAMNLVRYLGINTYASLGYNYISFLEKLLVEHADLYIGHEEMSMALSKRLILKGRRVAFDFEDWHSHDLMPKDRKYRPTRLLEDLEYFLLKHAEYTYTTSHTMANAMAEAYELKAPAVVYNSFPTAERKNMDGLSKDRTGKGTPSLYWFSQVISEGRGLELLCKALQLTTTPVELHLRGRITEAYHRTLKSLLPSHVSLVLHDVVPVSELISRIAEHDIGIAFEDSKPENKDCTISNKIFHYLQAGIAVLATKTKGQSEVKKMAPNAVCILEPNPEQIAEVIETLLQQPEKLKAMKLASWEAGEAVFAYESEASKLKEFVDVI